MVVTRRILFGTGIAVLFAPQTEGFAPALHRGFSRELSDSSTRQGRPLRASPPSLDVQEASPLEGLRQSLDAAVAPLLLSAMIAAAATLGATGALPAFAEDNEVYTSEASALGYGAGEDYEGAIRSAMGRLKGAKNTGQVLESMGAMAEAVGINNAEGEMNVFSPSFRRVTATELAEIKGKSGSLWGDDAQVADFYGFLKRQFDPYHVIELKGYLGVAPFLGGLAYLGLLFVQRNFEALFTPAYVAAAALVLGPIAAIYFLG